CGLFNDLLARPTEVSAALRAHPSGRKRRLANLRRRLILPGFGAGGSGQLQHRGTLAHTHARELVSASKRSSAAMPPRLIISAREGLGGRRASSWVTGPSFPPMPMLTLLTRKPRDHATTACPAS